MASDSIFRRRLRLSPDTRLKFRRFRRIRRGYWSLLVLLFFSVLSLVAELLVSSRALVVHYHDHWYFPTYGAIHTGREFGYDYAYEVDYRDLKKRIEAAGSDDWVLMPPVPYNAYENCYPGEVFKPRPPDGRADHWLGTDQLNRDILARLLYGFRSALLFSVGYVGLTYLVGVSLGCAMAFWGGWFDLVGQRLTEIWSLIPFLFVVIIIRSVVPSHPSTDLWMLLGIVVLFSWVPISYYMRSSTYREKVREVRGGGARAWGRRGADSVHAHHSEYGGHAGDVHPVHGGGGDSFPHGAGFPGLRTAAADPELGGTSAPGHRQSRRPLDRHLGIFRSQPDARARHLRG